MENDGRWASRPVVLISAHFKYAHSPNFLSKRIGLTEIVEVPRLKVRRYSRETRFQRPTTCLTVKVGMMIRGVRGIL